jgi:hypothetical protein
MLEFDGAHLRFDFFTTWPLIPVQFLGKKYKVEFWHGITLEKAFPVRVFVDHSLPFNKGECVPQKGAPCSHSPCIPHAGSVQLLSGLPGCS